MRILTGYNFKKTNEKEYVIKKVPVPTIVFYVGALFSIAIGIIELTNTKYFSGIFLTSLGIAFVYLRKLEPKKSQAVIKINSERLWTRNRGNKTWTSIICIKFRYEGTSQVYMDIYCSNDIVADEELSLFGINMSLWRLKRLLKRHVKVENH